jgi:hypothetical protein
MKPKDGGLAFPRPLPKGQFPPQDALRLLEQHAGMTLRDYLAARAMAGLLAMEANPRFGATEEPYNKAHAPLIAEHAYAIADAMLAERDKP